MKAPLRFGIFMPPIQPVGQNPTLHLERNLELLQHLDRLGFDEAWIGEHHSAGWELISCPEVFIATAAERTRHIRLGTGVTSLAYHHPLVVADRMVLLDHLTRGRVMLGVGPGSLPSDAIMMGIEPAETRRMMEESLEAIIALLRGDEPVTRESDWFTLRDARLNMRPYTHPRFPIVAASSVSPAGPRLAGRFGIGILSVAAMTQAGMEALDRKWTIAEERATEFGQTIDRRDWAIVRPMFVAESDRQAKRDLAFGLCDWRDYFARLSGTPFDLSLSAEDAVDEMNEMGFSVFGTPDRAIAQIEQLLDRTGGFGCLLLLAADWADQAATHRSYELFARYVMPHFQGQLEAPQTAWDRVAAQAENYHAQLAAAQQRAADEHAAERAARS